jgi:hypothetical protein
LKLSYTPEDGFAGGDSFNFNVQFNALTDGKLQANSVLEWDHSKYSTMVSAYTFAGEAAIIAFQIQIAADGTDFRFLHPGGKYMNIAAGRGGENAVDRFPDGA